MKKRKQANNGKEFIYPKENSRMSISEVVQYVLTKCAIKKEQSKI